ncbi:MAG: Maltodextrin ABC transporter, permease protein MdxF [Candidatus Bipolaricaulis sibiricus]|uniref:Maltose/maltodextrin transport system permease protein n=1 Tax=Bipolaricaulis sibiricus TaxID=2501609 RepID=A0A410FTG0_BIPS1|nr:MAG: Maltodextrin ABC transporter, permease protein MdxF [Candidatus Bipolaricaulis sibiricus]
MAGRGLVAHAVKLGILALLDAVAVWAAVSLLLRGDHLLLAVLAAGALLLNFVVLSRRAYPLRFLLPGLVFLFAMVVYPIGYTINVSLTNLQTGNLLTKNQVITQLENRYYLPPDHATFSYWAFRNPQGELRVILLADDGRSYLSERSALLPVDLADPRFVQGADGTVVAFDDFTRLSLAQIYQSLPALERLDLMLEGVHVRLATVREFGTYLRKYEYLRDVDAIRDLETGIVYTAREGYFTSPDGVRIEPGFQIYVGFRNYLDVLRNPGIRADFTRVFGWTVAWSFLTVFFSFWLGLVLAYLLNDPYVRGRFFYRSLLIIPYAMPAFISALVWAGLFNTDLGVINRIIGELFGTKVRWLQDPFWARTALIFINVWLTYPYMMIVSLGALQSIPKEMYEAARVDGATGWQRFWTITMPLLWVSVAPLLIGSFAFTFNNFTIIWLVTAGRPAVLGAATPAGATDILISWTYRLAFEGDRGNQLGLASAVSIIIFVIIATISAVNFRFTRALEDVSRGV